MCELVYLKPQNVFPIEDGDIPASYVSLPEGNCQFFENSSPGTPNPTSFEGGWMEMMISTHFPCKDSEPIDSQPIKKCLTFGYQVYIPRTQMGPPCFGGLTFKNRGQLGFRYIYLIHLPQMSEHVFSRLHD